MRKFSCPLKQKAIGLVQQKYDFAPSSRRIKVKTSEPTTQLGKLKQQRDIAQAKKDQQKASFQDEDSEITDEHNTVPETTN